ncbi:MAG: class I SAM-dependent methyltransferase [Bacillota bacterium]
MDFFSGRLKELSGGRILDVATGGGYAIKRMMESFKDYEKFIGIDIVDKEKLDKFQEGFDKKKVELIYMDAENMGFEDNTFDAVSISNSLHHLKNLDKVLSEMLRVLKPGGIFLINEMKKDDQTPSQLTHVKVHHWWGKIDTQKGITHNETLTRREILDITDRIGLAEYDVIEYADLESNPLEKEVIDDIHNSINVYTEKALGLPDYEAFKVEGEELRKWLEIHGFTGATQVIIIGRK